MRNIDRFADRAIMLVETFLRRFVVIRSNLQRRVGSFLGGPLSQADRFGGAVRASACHDLDPARSNLNRFSNHLLMLGMCQRWRFAGGAARNHTSGAGFDLKFNLLFQCFQAQ